MSFEIKEIENITLKSKDTDEVIWNMTMDANPEERMTIDAALREALDELEGLRAEDNEYLEVIQSYYPTARKIKVDTEWGYELIFFWYNPDLDNTESWIHAERVSKEKEKTYSPTTTDYEDLMKKYHDVVNDTFSSSPYITTTAPTLTWTTANTGTSTDYTITKATSEPLISYDGWIDMNNTTSWVSADTKTSSTVSIDGYNFRLDSLEAKVDSLMGAIK